MSHRSRRLGRRQHVAAALIALVMIAFWGWVALAQDDEEVIVEVPVESVVEAQIDEADPNDHAELTAPTAVAVDHDSIGVDVESAEDRGESFSWDTLDEKAVLEIWAVLAGFIMPPVIQVFKARGWGEREINLTSLLLAAAMTVGGAFARGELDNAAYSVSTFALLLMTTQAAYQKFWKAAVMSEFMNWIDRKTAWGPARTG